MAQASSEPGTSRSRVLRSAVAPHWLSGRTHMEGRRRNRKHETHTLKKIREGVVVDRRVTVAELDSGELR